ncbi:XAP5, circadian clock regulator-domain-containing protein [Pavlovales sp. CCMP2436]|nr:XAP5, circadian clock regulator-domain-containing protein [Pavlovales sp. CCMP2436]|mmetsp:Transcript_14780/g.37300  ORF Transcript_14780/g.37300 Transcript_14780/m.37300 type:complete len:342 (-) Transcript_14780:130-1155(-)
MEGGRDAAREAAHERAAASAKRDKDYITAVYEQQRAAAREITEKTGVKHIDDAFAKQEGGIETDLASRTVGLKKREDYTREREQLERERAEAKAKAGAAEGEEVGSGKKVDSGKKAKKKKKAGGAALSFELDEEGGDEGADEPKLQKVKKNPSVDTGFLPDREREAAELQRRQELQGIWEADQAKVKAEEIDVTYSYWDGAGHRFTTRVSKGTSIGGFLNKCRAQVKQLRNASADTLMFIKEDIIMPQHLTFYDLIVSKARGKSGPLFQFDVHEDIRLQGNAQVEKDETHAGKVVEKRWYEHNKEKFPASRWEVFDATKKFDSYSVHGGESYGIGVHSQLL